MSSDVHVFLLRIVLFEEKTWVSGYALRNKFKWRYDDHRIFRNLKSVLETYRPIPAKGSITIKSDQSSKTEILESNGRFFVELTGQHTNIRFYQSDLEVLVSKLSSYPRVFEPATSDFDIISDIDDTIIHSFTIRAAKRISSILFKSVKDRKPVEPTYQLFKNLLPHQPRVYYVSKSEANLFHLLSDIIIHHDLPAGPLFLTPWLRWSQLLNPKKGVDFKFTNIQKIISASPGKRFILIGDDTQNDMKVYTQVIESFPGRINAVFIHQTRRALSQKRTTAFQNLVNKGTKVHYYQSVEQIDAAMKDLS